MDLSDIANAVWLNAEEHGFHDAGINDSVAAQIANLHGEVSELWEAYRRDMLHSQCDKLVQLTCAEEELADIVIRALDTAIQLGIDIEKAVLLKHEYNKDRPFRHGYKRA